jgi:anti-sigma factor RsiW
VRSEPARPSLARSCDEALALLIDDSGVVPVAALAHLRTCTRCHRALSRHRALRADLRRLGHAPAPGERRLASEALLATILIGLDAEDRRTSRRHAWISRGAVAGGVAAGVAAGVVALMRGRRLVLAVG